MKMKAYACWLLHTAACLVVCCFLILLSTIAAAGPFVQNPADETWIKDTTVQHVTFYHRLSECGNTSVVLLRFENNGKHPVSVSWKNQFTIADAQGAQQLAGPASLPEKLLLPPGITGAVTCEDRSFPALVIRPASIVPTHSVTITGFYYRNPVVSN